MVLHGISSPMMMKLMNYLLITGTALHFLSLAGLACYGIHRLWMLYCWRNLLRQDKPSGDSAPVADELQPQVTVQLPLYNERFVAQRLLDSVAALDWPAERLQIQILDDSTDDTCAIVEQRAAYWRQQGIAMEVVHRRDRHGYKAGAMAAGMASCRGEFIAVFDADFIPQANFLRRMIPHFSTEKIAVVQARWGFLNSDNSWLTRIQALLLGPHFGIEHQVRCQRGMFFNFNGTAGVWRRSAIVDAGGWQADTVTEDLDLSYRAQLNGWQFVYVDEVEVPSELPESLAAFRTQQQRWSKGSIQTARKIMPRVLKSSLPVAVKFEALAHLLANLGWIFGALAALTVLPSVLWRLQQGYTLWMVDIVLFFFASGAILFYFFSYAWQRNTRELLPWLPLLPLLTLGLAPTLAKAAIQGMYQRGGEFVRTPKLGDQVATAFKQRLSSYRYQCPPLTNGLLGLYSLCPLWVAWDLYHGLGLVFLLFFPVGFFLVFAQQMIEANAR